MKILETLLNILSYAILAVIGVTITKIGIKLLKPYRRSRN